MKQIQEAIQTTSMKTRFFYLDKLRIFLTILVIVHHASIAYGGSGGWAIRETNLYLRTVRLLQRQLKRGISTKMLTASGEPLPKAINYARSIEGLLEDGSSWRCPSCGMYNHGSSNYCSNCGLANPNKI